MKAEEENLTGLSQSLDNCQHSGGSLCQPETRESGLVLGLLTLQDITPFPFQNPQRHPGSKPGWEGEMSLVGHPSLCNQQGCFQSAGITKGTWAFGANLNYRSEDWKVQGSVCPLVRSTLMMTGPIFPEGPFLERHLNAWPRPALVLLTTQLFNTYLVVCFSRCFL